MSDVSKLPAWPEKPHNAYGTTANYFEHMQNERDAYRARMLDLKEEVENLRDSFLFGEPRYEEWLDAVNALLAACEREEGR